MSEDWEEQWDKIEIQRARDWWEKECPDWVKSRYSIWVILAMYGKYRDEQEGW